MQNFIPGRVFKYVLMHLVKLAEFGVASGLARVI